MTSGNGGTYDPQGDWQSANGAGAQREIVPLQGGGPLQGGAPSQGSVPLRGSVPLQGNVVGKAATPGTVATGREAPKPRVLVQRRTLMIMSGIIVVLLVAVVGLVLTKGSSNAPKAPAAATLPTAATTSAPAPAPTGAATLSPSPELSASPSGTSAAGASASASASASDTASPTGSDGPPVGTQDLGAPVDGEVYTRQDVHISNVDYPHSDGFYCPTSGLVDWNVAGYTTLTAVFGIPDDARSATGITNTVTFTDQNGHQLGTAKTSIGQPAQIQIALKGAARLVMTCDRQGTNDSTNNWVALGNASISTS